MKAKADSLGFWKIICTYMIVALHYGYSSGWKLAVEFFFIVSGLLMAYEYDSKRTSYKEYVKKRICRLWPHYIFSFIVYIVVSTFLGGNGTQFLAEIKHSVLYIFMLQILARGDYAVNYGGAWYVSSLFISSIILYAVFNLQYEKKIKKIGLFKCVLFIIFIIMGYCSQFIFGKMCILSYESKRGLIFIPGLIRGISEMSVGIMGYFGGSWVKQQGIFNKHRELWSGLELLLMVSTIMYTYYRLDNYVLVIIMFTISIIIGFFVEHNQEFSKVTSKFSRYTYPIYMNHITVLTICVNLPLVYVMVLVTVYSMLTFEIVDRINKCLFMRRNRINNLEINKFNSHI